MKNPGFSPKIISISSKLLLRISLLILFKDDPFVIAVGSELLNLNSLFARTKNN